MKKVKPYVAKDRLNALADYLDTVPKKKFNFSIFANKSLSADNECGATGCALGWACTMPRFQRMGLQLVIDGYDGTSDNRRPNYAPIITKDGKTVATYFETAEQIFGITTNEAEGLFMPDGAADWQKNRWGPPGKASAKQVASNIRKFIKWKWPAGKKARVMESDEP